MREQNWARALDYLHQAEKLAPQVPGIHLNIGLAYYRQGDYATALPEFKTALEQQPDSPQARRLLGLCYLFEEHYAEAAEQLEPLWPAANTDLSYLYSLAVAAGNSHRTDVEERATSRLLEIGKDSPVIHLLLGKAYLAHGDDDHALTEFQTAAGADSKLPLIHYNLGVVYRQKGDFEKARAEFLEDAALEPSIAYNYDQLGLLYAQQGKSPQAETYFELAVKRDSKLGTSWFGLAKIYREQKRYSDALHALDKAGAIDPQSASVHYLRGQILLALKRQLEAQSEFALVHKLQKETTDRLERQITGAEYRDPNLAN